MIPLNTERLISLVSICDDFIRKTDHFTPAYTARASEYMNAVCEACGVSLKSGDEATIGIPANDFNIRWDKQQCLQVFQENLLHFFNHYKRFTGNARRLFYWKLARCLQKDLDERAVIVFHAMTKNFVDQMMTVAVEGDDDEDIQGQGRKTANINDKNLNLSVEDLCSGDLEKTLCLVPSRELARKMGISDQKLRREIYLARQRALKKRTNQKGAKLSSPSTSASSSNIINSNIEDFETFFDLDIPTCASPPSSTTSNSSENENEFETMNLSITVNNNNHGTANNFEWSIESIIKSDLFEY